MSNLTRTADYLSDSLEALGYIIMSKKSGEGLPLVAFRLATVDGDEKHYDEFALAHALRVRGWVVPAYTMAPKANGLKMLRVVIREDFTRPRADALIADIRQTAAMLDEMDRDSIKRQNEFIHQHHTASGKAKHNHPKYRKEKHSIQGKVSTAVPPSSLDLLPPTANQPRPPDWQDPRHLLNLQQWWIGTRLSMAEALVSEGVSMPGHPFRLDHARTIISRFMI